MTTKASPTSERAATERDADTEEDGAVVCVRGANGEVVCGPVVDEHGAPMLSRADLHSDGPATTKYCTICGAIYRKDFARCPNDGGAIGVAAIDPQLGRQLGHYVIDDIIGEGGMGRVYRAHHAYLSERRFAIKVLIGDVAATTSMRRRFAQEAELASQLEHPNLVSVLDFGRARGLMYIVMELVESRVLGGMLTGRPMSPGYVARMASAICEGLAYVHDAGLVHRDLKPDNVLVVSTPRGDVPRLTDFGLAVSLEVDEGERLTSTGMAMGTPAYAPPEQISGLRVDHRADLYALGVSMYEMLTGGRLPWTGSVFEMAAAKGRDEPPSFGDIRVPRALEIVITSLLRTNPADRPESARDVIAALSSIPLG